MVRLLHLSDIHFRRRSGDQWDVDKNVRAEVLNDSQQSAETAGSPTLILVGGDVAFSGHKDEYDTARDWITQLLERTSATVADVMVVPGNHDVDQKLIKESQSIYDTQEKLRRAEGEELNQLISTYMNDKVMNRSLFLPIEDFNTFAAGFDSDISFSRPTRQRDLVLNDGTPLKIYGLNSTLVSNYNDNTYKRVVLGAHQTPVRDTVGPVRVVLCHHPHDWWQDGDRVKSQMNEHVSLQLFGHKHEQTHFPLPRTLQLVAGAIHPSRLESNWKPRYNWVDLAVTEEHGKRQLAIRVHPRVWYDEKGRFGTDFNLCEGKEFIDVRVQIDPWRKPADPPKTPTPAPVQQLAQDATRQPEEEPKMSQADALRRLAFRFFELPHVRRMSITIALGLLTDEDEGLSDREIFQRAIQRAISNNQLAALWDQVEAAHPRKDGGPNPFKAN